MTGKSLLLLVVSGVCGLVASVVVTKKLGGSPVEAPRVDVRAVVVAKQDLTPGEQLKPEMLQVENRPVQGLPNPESTFTDISQVTGQTLQIPVFTGELVIKAKLGSTIAQLVKRLPPGMRAGTARVDSSGVAGLINPGDHVDVLWMYTSPSSGQTSIRLLLQNIQVLAVGQKTTSYVGDVIAKTKPRAQDYTLLVTNQQYQKLTLAASKGKVHLALRGGGDDTIEVDSELDMETVMGLLKPEPSRPTLPVLAMPARPRTWEIIYQKGGEVSNDRVVIPPSVKNIP